MWIVGEVDWNAAYSKYNWGMYVCMYFHPLYQFEKKGELKKDIAQIHDNVC